LFKNKKTWKYICFQRNGVSVHDPENFYDNKTINMELLHQYGGVCGALSKLGCPVSILTIFEKKL